LTFRTKRGFRACNVSSIARLDYRFAPASLEVTLHDAATSEPNDPRPLRLKGDQARRAWRMLDEKGLLWLTEPGGTAIPTATSEAADAAQSLEFDED
jgi:hypothetical protein